MNLDATETGLEASTSENLFDEAMLALRRLEGDALDDVRIEQVVVGVFVTGVKLSDGCAGVAYTPPELVARAGRRILRGDTPAIRGMTASVVGMGGDVGPFGPVIRLATLNALSVPSLSVRSRGGARDDAVVFRSLVEGRRVCMVGAMIPFIQRLLDFSPAAFFVADQKWETLNAVRGCTIVDEADLPATLAGCDTAILTGAAIANGTIGELLGQVSSRTAVAVIGPTAGFVPEPLFDRGVALVGSTIVTDADRAMDILSEGGGMYPMFDGCIRKYNLANIERMRELGLPVDWA